MLIKAILGYFSVAGEFEKSKILTFLTKLNELSVDQKRILDSNVAAINKKSNKIEFAEALFDFQGNNRDELSFKKGNILKIVDKQTGDWWLASLGSKKGLIPNNYVKVCKLISLTEISNSDNLAMLKESKNVVDFYAEDSFAELEKYKVLQSKLLEIEEMYKKFGQKFSYSLK